ncbi:MAG: carboxypeptidase-like regulatory domain-containing protein, partial [Bacteroidaceae bacterium]|nr:carboxypeptidase-like regulatory domain-containing protein [Bacteroidaceae bacterium]
FNKHFFLEGYYTHGFKSHNSYYGVVVDYCFNKKKYSPYEFPMRKIRFESSYEVTSAADRFLQNSKDNLFVSLKTEKVNMQYKTNMQRLSFTWETDYGLNFNTAFKLESNEVAGDLHFIHVTDGREDKTLRTTQWSAEVHFCPGQTYIMTKQDRWPLNKDRPDFVIRHTVGIKGLFGGQFNTNQTDISVFKRQWLGSWGRMDFRVRASAQWNKVPFQFLLTPPMCLSYVEQEGTLNMLHNMELFMDRRVSWSVEWNLNGKIFNRIPLLKKLKLREYIGFKGCWGMLTDKNNPAKNTTDDLLYAFPDNRSYAIDSHVPYMEFSCGIRNILKLFGVDYVRRLNYLDIPGAKKNGVRFNLTLSF